MAAINDSLVFRPGPPPFTGNKPAGSGGSGGISSGIGDPLAAPTNTAIDSIYFDTSTTPENEWHWPAGGSAWAQS